MWNEIVPREEYAEAIAVLCAIVNDPEFRRSRKPRILAAQAMHRIINHLSDAGFLALGTSPFGPWLMRSLQSSVRELRLAAAYVQ
jgi:serine/threonine-protein kinase ATR